MNALRNSRLALTAFWAALVLLIVELFLVFFVPKLLDVEKDLHNAAAWVGPTRHVVSIAQQPWIGLVVFSAFVVTAVWRVMAAQQLRRAGMMRGFAVEPPAPRR